MKVVDLLVRERATPLIDDRITRRHVGTITSQARAVALFLRTGTTCPA
jgi:hypothetical protein